MWFEKDRAVHELYSCDKISVFATCLYITPIERCDQLLLKKDWI